MKRASSALPKRTRRIGGGGGGGRDHPPSFSPFIETADSAAAAPEVRMITSRSAADQGTHPSDEEIENDVTTMNRGDDKENSPPSISIMSTTTKSTSSTFSSSPLYNKRSFDDMSEDDTVQIFSTDEFLPVPTGRRHRQEQPQTRFQPHRLDSIFSASNSSSSSFSKTLPAQQQQQQQQQPPTPTRPSPARRKKRVGGRCKITPAPPQAASAAAAATIHAARVATERGLLIPILPGSASKKPTNTSSSSLSSTSVGFGGGGGGGSSIHRGATPRRRTGGKKTTMKRSSPFRRKKKYNDETEEEEVEPPAAILTTTRPPGGGAVTKKNLFRDHEDDDEEENPSSAAAAVPKQKEEEEEDDDDDDDGDPSPPRPPPVRLGMRKHGFGLRSQATATVPLPQCSSLFDNDPCGASAVVSSFLFSDEDFLAPVVNTCGVGGGNGNDTSSSLTPTPSSTTTTTSSAAPLSSNKRRGGNLNLSISPFASVDHTHVSPHPNQILSNNNNSFSTTPREITSPHWSKPVPVNPFSPVPTEHLLNTSANSRSFDSAGSGVGGMYYTRNGSPIIHRQHPKQPVKPRKGEELELQGGGGQQFEDEIPRSASNLTETTVASTVTTFLSDVGGGRSSFYLRNGRSLDEEEEEDEDKTSPMDVTSFPSTLTSGVNNVNNNNPPSAPAKSRSTFRRRYYYHTDMEEDSGGGHNNNNELMYPSYYPTRNNNDIERQPPSLLRKDRHPPNHHDSPPQCRPDSPTHPTTSPAGSRFENDFQELTTLGTGSFGTVLKCISRTDGCLYAIKIIQRQLSRSTSEKHHLLQEVYALAALCSQSDPRTFHIVRYHQAWLEERRLYIQMELCTSTVRHEMARGTLLEESRRYRMIREVCLALELIHGNDMVHLDIKPDNIFVKNDQFKLGDFGLASKSTGNKDAEEGDARYMSRELLSGEYKDLTKCDIFSLGATIYEICRGTSLPSSGQQWQNLRSHQLSLTTLRKTRPELKSIISDMMHPDPNLRPHATKLLERRQLLSEEQKELIAEKNRVTEASLALRMQEERIRCMIEGGSGITNGVGGVGGVGNAVSGTASVNGGRGGRGPPRTVMKRSSSLF